MGKEKRTFESLSIGNITKKIAPESKNFVSDRFTDLAPKISLDEIKNGDIMFMHSVLCQTSLPYRNPKNVTIWEKKQGNASLVIQTVQVKNPKTKEFEQIGLPFGTKARLILSHINTEAIINKSSRVYVQDSMTKFIKSLGLPSDGRAINSTKEQLKRLAASNISLNYADENQYLIDQTQIIKRLNLWFPKDDNQKVLWESYLDLSSDYFESLMSHAIPLDMRAMAALSNNAMALDIYAWLAQRLHRISSPKGNFIHWAGLKEQFGFNYKHMYKFKQVFRETISRVLIVYPEAFRSVTEIDNKGLQLFNAKPPIKKSSHLIIKP